MTPSKLAAQKAIVDRLQAAVDLPVGTDPGVPGVEVGDDSEAQVSENTSAVHTTLSQTIRIRHPSETEAKKVAEAVVAALTERTDRLTLDGPFVVIDQELIGSATQRTRRVDGPDRHTQLVQIDYRITRT